MAPGTIIHAEVDLELFVKVMTVSKKNNYIFRDNSFISKNVIIDCDLP